MGTPGVESNTAVTDRDHVAGRPLPAIGDDVMQQGIAAAQPYVAVLLRTTSAFKRPEVDPIIWEHGRRNFALQADGVLAVVLPAADDSDWAGLAVFRCSPEEVAEIMDHDPGVQAGIFSYELHPVRGFFRPGVAS